MIRIGVIGYGYWGPKLVRNCAELDGAYGAWVVDPQHERLASVATR